MYSDYNKPLNIGSDEMVSMNDMAKMVLEIDGKNLPIRYAPTLHKPLMTLCAHAYALTATSLAPRVCVVATVTTR